MRNNSTYKTMKLARRLIYGLACLMTTAQLSAVELEQIRTGQDEFHTRIVLDLSGKTDYQVFTLRAPDRIVVDLARASAGSKLAPAVEHLALVNRIRYAHRGATGLRVVLDLSQQSNVRHMSLPPSGVFGNRLVLDLSNPLMVVDETPAAAAPEAVAVSKAANDVPEAKSMSPAARPAQPGTITQAPKLRGSLLDSLRESDFLARTAESFRAGLAAGDSAIDRLAQAITLDVSGEIGFEGRMFFQDPIFNRQPGENISMSFEPEIYLTWDDDQQSLLFVPFVRWDQHDSRRTHGDLRELSYIYAARDWELRTGVRKVFWGVAESNHLVDIINQTDFVENIDFEDKLGQPMVNLALIRDWGTIDFFVLPGFRERTFPGRDGRFQGPLRISDDAEYESSAETTHVDYAVRYSHYFGAFDVGLYHFWGTTREPLFNVGFKDSGEPVLLPFYNIIHQTGADLQATLGNWLIKFEALRRQGQGDTFVAAVGGFEYTFVGIFDTVLDLGVLGEVHWDERGKKSPMPFNDDIFVGSRLAFNDAADSQILGGVMSDLNGGGHFLNVEASRRVGEYWKVELELRLLLGIQPENPLYSFRRDDHVQLTVLRSF